MNAVGRFGRFSVVNRANGRALRDQDHKGMTSFQKFCSFILRNDDNADIASTLHGSETETEKPHREICEVSSIVRESRWKLRETDKQYNFARRVGWPNKRKQAAECQRWRTSSPEKSERGVGVVGIVEAVTVLTAGKEKLRQPLLMRCRSIPNLRFSNEELPSKF